MTQERPTEARVYLGKDGVMIGQALRPQAVEALMQLGYLKADEVRVEGHIEGIGRVDRAVTRQEYEAARLKAAV